MATNPYTGGSRTNPYTGKTETATNKYTGYTPGQNVVTGSKKLTFTKPSQPTTNVPAATTTPVKSGLPTIPTATREDSRELLRSLFVSYGFDEAQINSITQKALAAQAKGYAPAEIVSIAQTWDEYKTRFAGNQERIKKGLAALGPAEYLKMESEYARALSYYNMPKGFYDDPKTDFANWIANDVSVEEITGRVETAFKWANNVDPETKKALKDYYGLDDSNIAAYALDRTRALPLIEKQAAAVSIGAEAVRTNLNFGRSFAETLVDQGVSQGAAREAFTTTAASMPAVSELAAIDNTALTAEDVAKSQLGLDAGATKKIGTLASKERARFSGRSGGANILGQNVSGSY